MSEFGTATPHATHRRRSLKLRTVAALTSVALFASACGFGGSDEAQGSGLQPGDYTIAAAEGVSDSVIVNGHIAPIRAMNITTSVQSEVEKIAVQPGDRVQKEQFLASMNTEQLDRQLAAQERQQANAQADATQALEQAQAQLNAHDQSMADGTNQTIRQAQAQVDQAQAAYDAAVAAQGGRSATRVADVFTQMAGNLSSHLPGNSSHGANQGPKAPGASAPSAPGGAGAPSVPGAAGGAGAAGAPGGAGAPDGMSPEQLAQIAGADGAGAGAAGGAPMGVDEAYAALQDAKAGLAAAQSQAQQERQQLQGQVDSARRQAESAGISESDGTLEYQLQEATLYSPLAGVVTSVDVEEGDIPQGKLLSLADDSSLLIKSEVREADVPNIKQGNRVEFTSTATGDKKFKGRVKRIAPAADESSAAPAGMPGGMPAGGSESGSESGSVSFPVEIEVTGDTKGLLLGGTVRAEIITQESPDALNVPLDAVYGDEGDEKVLVMATDGDDASSGVVEERKVETGASNDVDIAITGGELKAGDIVINWPDEYSDKLGDKVSISDPGFDPERVREAKEGKPKDEKKDSKKNSKDSKNDPAAEGGEDK